MDPSGPGKRPDASARPDARAAATPLPAAELAELVALPFLLEWAEPLTGRNALVLGSGAPVQKLRRYGAATVARGETLGEAAAVAAASIDLVLVYFHCDRLDCQQSRALLTEAQRTLRPGGKCIVAATHPFRGLAEPQKRPGGYFSARGSTLPDGTLHKTLQDHFECLDGAGFRGMPEVTELQVTEALAAREPQRLGPLCDQPLFLALRLFKAGAR